MEIPDARDPPANPLQQHKISRRPRRASWSMHEHRRPPLHQTGSKMPILELGIVVKVPAHFASAIHARPGDELEAHLVSQHVAYGVEIARVEPLDIGGEKRTLGFSQNGQRSVVRLLRQHAQAGATAMQRGLDRRYAAADDVADLLEGIAKYVHEDDAA